MSEEQPIDVEVLFDCDRIVEAGAAFHQAAGRPAWGGLVINSARFVEFGTRATVLYVPDLFRLDLQPVQDTVGIQLRSLCARNIDWQADPESFDPLREGEQARASEFQGLVDLPGARIGIKMRVFNILDAEAGGTYIASRAAVAVV